MHRHIHSARDLLIPVIDFFYPPFRRWMDIQTFRYAACGGGNTVLGLLVYYVFFKFILREQMLDLGFYAFTAYTAALFFSFCVSFPVGFFLMKYVVFSDSNVRGRSQLFRYLFSFLFTLTLNYIMLKFLVEKLHIFVMLSQVITTIVVILTSYVIQRFFTFRVNKVEAKTQ
ncbi:MAG: GtrA family protein [Chitinophagaceae bacterium]|nr:GtrA family protein [Chitinophagaceae bacterium]